MYELQTSVKAISVVVSVTATTSGSEGGYWTGYVTGGAKYSPGGITGH